MAKTRRRNRREERTEKREKKKNKNRSTLVPDFSGRPSLRGTQNQRNDSVRTTELTEFATATESRKGRKKQRDQDEYRRLNNLDETKERRLGESNRQVAQIEKVVWLDVDYR